MVIYAYLFSINNKYKKISYLLFLILVTLLKYVSANPRVIVAAPESRIQVWVNGELKCDTVSNQPAYSVFTCNTYISTSSLIELYVYTANPPIIQFGLVASVFFLNELNQDEELVTDQSWFGGIIPVKVLGQNNQAYSYLGNQVQSSISQSAYWIWEYANNRGPLFTIITRERSMITC